MTQIEILEAVRKAYPKGLTVKELGTMFDINGTSVTRALKTLKRLEFINVEERKSTPTKNGRQTFFYVTYNKKRRRK